MGLWCQYILLNAQGIFQHFENVKKLVLNWSVFEAFPDHSYKNLFTLKQYFLITCAIKYQRIHQTAPI